MNLVLGLVRPFSPLLSDLVNLTRARYSTTPEVIKMPHRTCSPLSDSILFPSPDSAKPPPHPQSTSLVFKTLPPELFQLIASFIPFSAAVSLTLTCRKASIILGSRYLDWLNVKGNRETLEFIKLLERDLPRHIVCVECEVLHSRKQL